jgi:cell division transport system permease protein
VLKRLKNHLLRHAQACLGSLGGLARAPFASLMTIAVIGITLALPAGFYLVIDNIQRLSRGWEGNGQISLFLRHEVGEDATQKLAERIRRLPSVDRVEYISREQALAEFRRLSGFGAALDSLDRNPLPAVLVVRPAAAHQQPADLEALVKELGAFREVDLAQLDLEWIRRLSAWLALAQRGVWLLAGLLGLAVLLIVGNTVRLAVLSRREEIEVTKLVGGTNAFIRRPFLYSGLSQGLLGAALAWLLVSLGLVLLSGPISELGSLYGSEFRITGLELNGTLALLGTGALLGWLGSRMAVTRHLRAIEPR